MAMVMEKKRMTQEQDDKDFLEAALLHQETLSQQDDYSR